MNHTINVTVWNEFEDEKRHPIVMELYPGGIHEYIASFLREEKDMTVRTATFHDEKDFGIPDEVLEQTDVLIVYSHMLQELVSGERVQKVIDRVTQDGMGIIFLHSALWMNLMQRLVGPGSYNGYREIGERERIWVVNQGHPIAAGLPAYFDIPQTEMYGEPASFPEPDELVFLSWYQGGEAARSGMTWRRGKGKVFYFSPGHARYTVMQSEHYQRVIINAVRWAVPPLAPPPADRGAHAPALEQIGEG